MLESLLNGLGGDLVEGDARDHTGGQLQRLGDMPGDGFPFTVIVRGEIDLLGRFDGLLQERKDFLRFRKNHVLRLKIIRFVHTKSTRRQVADMAQCRDDGIAAPQELGDRFLLGR